MEGPEMSFLSHIMYSKQDTKEERNADARERENDDERK